jgi:curved DNA-binding protein CbpA
MPRAPFDPSTDYYRLLGVPPTAAPDEIQAAYRRLAKAYHPDLNAGSPSAAARMARVNVAKSVLLDPHVRSAYDQVRRARFGPVAGSAGAARPRPAPAGPAAARRVAAGHPGARAAYPAARTVAWSAVPRRGGRRLDRHSAILLAVVAPLLGALLLYVVDAVEVAGRPTPAPPPDLAFTQRPHARTEGTAQTAFFMVAGQPPNRGLAISANNEIRSALDSTPEGEMLRAVGRRLVQAGTTGDQQAWDSAVLDLCVLAKHC